MANPNLISYCKLIEKTSALQYMNVFNRLSAAPSRWLLLLTIALLPFEHLPTTQFHGYTAKLSYLAAIACLLSLLLERGKYSLRSWKLDLPEYSLLALSVIAFATALTVAPDRKRALIFSCLWLFVFLMYATTKRLLSEQLLRERATTLLLWVTAGICLFGIYQYLGDSLGLPASATGLRTQYTKIVFGFPRISSVALEPLYFSNYLLVPFFLCLERLLRVGKPLPYVLLLSLITLNIILGISRGAYLALAIGFCVFLFCFFRSRQKLERKRWAGVGVALVMAISLAVLGISVLNGKKATSNFVNHAAATDAKQEASVTDRFTTYRLAGMLFKQRPLFGFGPSSFGVITGNYPKSKPLNGYGIVNNEYLELLAEVGIVGTFFFAAFVILTVIAAVRTFGKQSIWRMQTAALMAGCLGIFVQYNFFSTLYILYIWVFLGWLASFSVTEKLCTSRALGE